MSRRRNGEMDFGSDSFLDIIANIVGILIILIVVAGVRAARTPTPVVVSPTRPEAKQPATSPKPEAPPVLVEDRPPEVRPQLAPPVPVPLPEPDAELPAAIASLKRDLAEMKDEQYRLQLELIARNKDEANERRQMQAMTSSFQHDSENGAALRDRLAGLRESLQKNRLTLAALQKQYDEAERKGNRSERIVHKLTPVGKDVADNEVHFRLAGGKVAKVPVEELVKSMREDVVRRKDWLLKFPVHRGSVGPIDGFRMHYLVKREVSSVADELRSGYGHVRLELGGWKIEPADDLKAEDENEALRVGSSFDRELSKIGSRSTITFWVYPDSFALFRRLQSAVHEQGLRVAARPLPFGMPIAGSPRGTRSSGQ